MSNYLQSLDIVGADYKPMTAEQAALANRVAQHPQSNSPNWGFIALGLVAAVGVGYGGWYVWDRYVFKGKKMW
jgi:hypothetical protein